MADQYGQGLIAIGDCCETSDLGWGIVGLAVKVDGADDMAVQNHRQHGPLVGFQKIG